MRAVLLAVLVGAAAQAGEPISKAAKAKLVGPHVLSLQWLTDDVPTGSAEISERDGVLVLEGIHEGKAGDYLKVSGIIIAADAKTFTLDGSVESRVSYLNDGKPCAKPGKHVFRISGKRKYWRMADMMNCDGQSTDYVDVYFAGPSKKK